jgi:hypothetical protein
MPGHETIDYSPAVAPNDVTVRAGEPSTGFSGRIQEVVEGMANQDITGYD